MAKMAEIREFLRRMEREQRTNRRLAVTQEVTQWQDGVDPVAHLRRAAMALEVPMPPERGKATSSGRDLYAMRNEVGRIKIGRSSDCEMRRKTLEIASGTKIALIAVVWDHGHEERQIHESIATHRVIGEWFDPTEEVEVVVADLIERARFNAIPASTHSPHSSASVIASNGFFIRVP